MVTTNEPNIYETGVLDTNAEGNFVYTTLDAAINWIRKNSLWPWPAPGTIFPASAPK